ncbi:GTP pyrophosphokinase family protein [Chloroflexota bacterium]
MRQDEIIREYSKIKDDYEEFTSVCVRLIEQFLIGTNIELLPITSRTKGMSSLEKKLSLRSKPYRILADITDLSGLRIITYFSDDVDKVASIIEQEFDVDPNKSVDKRKLLAPNTFGYLSLQLICRLSPERLDLSEYKRFHYNVCEIQIRSVLQHAWAEIQHDRGYKTIGSIPSQIQRRFSRLAGLLEIADDEFIGIRDGLLEYERDSEERILNNPTDVLIDRVSIITLIKIDTEIKELDDALADYSKIQMEDMSIDYADARVEELQYIGLKTIEDIKLALKENHDTIIKLFKLKVKVPTLGSLYRGISLYYLTQILLAEEGDSSAVTKKLTELKISPPSEAPELSKLLIATVRKNV